MLNGENVMSKLQELIDVMKSQGNDNTIKKAIDDLTDVVRSSDRHVHVEHNNIQNNIQNNVVIVNNYGKYSMDHITKDYLDWCVFQRKNGVLKLIDKIYFDPNKPENHNVKLVSKKRETFGTYKDGSWELASKNSVLHDMINHGYKVLYQHYLETIDKDEDDAKEGFSYYAFLTNLTAQNSNMYYQLRKDLFVMVENATLYVIGK
jgi:hypothetical protein